MSNMTREEFLDNYFLGRLDSYRELKLKSYIALLCNCGIPSCPGWSMIMDDNVASHLQNWGEREER